MKPQHSDVPTGSDWYLTPPRALYYAATYDCARYCAYCNLHAMVKSLYGSHRGARELELDLATVKRVLREARDVGVKLVKLSGGEPFARPDMFEIIEYGVGLGLKMLPVTRHAFSEREADRLAATGLRLIAFSVDSLVAETNRSLHRDPTLGDRLLASVERVSSRGLESFVTVVITRHNEAEYEELVRTFKEVGVSAVSPTMLVGPTFTLRAGPCGEFDPELCVPRHEFIERERRLLETNARYGVSSEIPDVERAFADVCPSADTAFVAPDGSMSYCGQTTDLFFGNLKQRSLMDVWTSPERKWLLRPPRLLYSGTECEDCEWFDTCNRLGRCYFATIRAGPFHRPESNRLCKRVREASVAGVAAD